MFLGIRMALYLLFGALAGQGFEFIQFDQETGQVDINFNLDSAITAGLGLLGFGGTFLASFTDRVRGPIKEESR